MNIVAIVQARLNSSRLPHKVMKTMNGKSVIQILLSRLSRAVNLDEIIIATTDSTIDDDLVEHLDNLGFPSFRGSENDVLERFFLAAEEFNAEAIVRITGDCPFIDPQLVDKMIDEYRNTNLDYISNIIDPFDGVVDIEKKIIRYTNKDTVLDDPLRMIRLVRLCSKLGFSVEHGTLNYFKDNAVLLNNVSKERIRDEIIEIFSLKNSYKSIFMLDELKLLNVIFPEVGQTINVEQLGLHDKDVYDHLIASLYFVEKLIDDELFEKINADIFAHDKSIIPYIKLATFLHDIGKPGTKEFKNEKITFISHDELGSTIAFDILTRLKFSLKTIGYIKNLIKHHLRLGHLISLDMEPSDKSLRKLNRDCGEIILELTYLDFADYLATSKFNFDNYIDHYNKLGKIYFRILNISTEFTKKTLNIINGHQIMEIFGLNEGPEVGRVLHAIEQEVINNGEITKENAIKLAKTILNK